MYAVFAVGNTTRARVTRRAVSPPVRPGALKAKAAALKNGEGLHIIQTFEPVPLYPVLALMGFERHTEKVSSSEYHVWFYRVRKGE